MNNINPNTISVDHCDKKGNIFRYILMFFIFLLSSLANSMVQDAWFLLVGTVSLGLYARTRVKIRAQIYHYGIGILLFYNLGIYYTFHVMPGMATSVRYLSYYLIGVYSILLYRKMFFFYFERVLLFLVVVSLFFYTIEFFYFDFLLKFLTSIQDVLGIAIPDTFKYKNYATIIIYTLNSASAEITDIRNSGFVFEPGYFAVLIAFAIFFHVRLYGFSKKRNLFFYILAILSTQSTTGILTLGIVAIYYLLNLKSKYRFYAIVASILIMLGGIYSPQGYAKINDIFSGNLSAFDYMSMAEQNSDQTISMGRFVGLVFQVSEVADKNPWTGYFGVESNRNISSIHGNLTSANGIGTFVFRFGFVGFILLLVLLYHSSDVIITKYFGQSYRILFIIFFLICLFSFPFINTIFFWVIILYGWVNKISEKGKSISRFEMKPAEIQITKS